MRRAAGPFTAAASLFGLSLILLWRGGGDGDIAEFQRYGSAITDGQLPYRAFHLEYPPGAVPFFTIPALGPAHEYLTIFRLLAVAGVLLGLLLLSLLLDRLGAPRPWHYGGVLFAAASPALLGAFALRRFDMWSAALCLGALLLLVDRRPLWAFGVLAVAVLVKTYPLALLPLMLLSIERRARLHALAVFCAVGLVALVPFLAIAHVGLYLSYAGQWNRHLQLETFGSSVLLALHRGVRIAFDSGSYSVFGSGADAVAGLQTLLQVLGVAAAAVLFARSRRTPWDLTAAAVTTLAVAAFAGKVLSPQFLLWVAPLVVLSRSIAASALLAGAMLLTNLLFPDRYQGLIARHNGEIWLLVGRNALLIGVLAALFVGQTRRKVNVMRRG